MNTHLVARRCFHTLAVAALAAVVVVGFARTYYLRFLFDLPPLPRAAHVHGIVATVWLVLHYTQARLIAVRRDDLHRRLGIFAACVAALLAAQAASLAIGNAAAGHAPPGRDPLQFLSASLGTTAVFVLFVVSALAMRRRREWHKRLMLLATLNLIAPAIGRLDTLIMQPMGLPRAVLAFYVTCGFLAWAWAHDWRTRGRVHPAYVVGGLLLLVSMPARRWLGMTDAWQPIARWLMG
jgi:hypothetical protein